MVLQLLRTDPADDLASGKRTLVLTSHCRSLRFSLPFRASHRLSLRFSLSFIAISLPFLVFLTASLSLKQLQPQEG